MEIIDFIHSGQFREFYDPVARGWQYGFIRRGVRLITAVEHSDNGLNHGTGQRRQLLSGQMRGLKGPACQFETPACLKRKIVPTAPECTGLL